jgi:hypothetical protein
MAFPYFSAKPCHCSCKRKLPSLWLKPTLASQLRYRVYSVFCEVIVNLNIVVSFYHTTAMKRGLEDDEIERQLKCKVCDVGLCFLKCFKEYYTKARFSYVTQGLKPVYTSA